jgi:hypothetical protein
MCIKISSKEESAPLLVRGNFFMQYLIHPQ